MAVVTEKEVREKIDEWGKLQLKIVTLQAKSERIEKWVKKWLKTSGRKLTITGDVAIGKRYDKTTLGNRVIPLAAFLAVTADLDEADRAECLIVAVKKAEELLGKTAVDKIANRPTKTETVEELELKVNEVDE